MLKTMAAFGLVLLLPSVPLLYWVHSQEAKSQQQIQVYKERYKKDAEAFASQMTKDTAGQIDSASLNSETIKKLKSQERERLLADIEELAAGAPAPSNASWLYGKDWVEQVVKYKTEKRNRTIIFTVSLITSILGGILAGISIAGGLFKLLMAILSIPGRIWRRMTRKMPEGVVINTPITPTRSTEQKEQPAAGITQLHTNGADSAQYSFASMQKSLDQTHEALQCMSESIQTANGALSRELNELASKMCIESQNTTELKLGKLQAQIEQLATLIMEDRQKEVSDDQAARRCESKLEQLNQVIDGLNARVSENLQSESAQAASDPELNSRVNVIVDQTSSISKMVRDFSAQFAAIRDYTTYQQQRLAKLDDGYDWNIIKHVCMRIIRCIDNLDSRIRQLDEVGVNTDNLAQVRDELAFVLESSGVEAFGVRIGSDYKGQETRVQVIDEKEYTDEPGMAGKIAELVQPGYHYMLTDDRVKVVRPAQVKLYAVESMAAAGVQ